MTYQGGQEAIYALTEGEAKPLITSMLDNYKQARDEIIAEMERIYGKYLSASNPQDYYNIMLQYDRQNKLLFQVTEIYNDYAKVAGKQTMEISSLAMTNTFYRNQFMLTWFDTVGVMSFSMLDPKLIELTVTGTQEAWLAIKSKLGAEVANVYQPAYGTLSDLLQRNDVNNLSKISQAITQGFINGQSIDKVTSNFMDIFGASEYQAERIARTEFTRSAGAGDYAATLDASEQGLNLKRMWVATLDDRTRESHQEADGQIVGIDEPFIVDGEEGMYPGDFPSVETNINCRCSVVTLIDGDMPELRRGTNPETGKKEIFSFKTYNEYMESNGMVRDDTGKWIKE